jgi:hygromycin-B 4-O-kinase
MDISSAPTDDEARSFVARRWGPAAGESVAPLGAGEWSRAFAFTAAASTGVAATDPAGARWTPEMVIRFGRHRTDFVKDRTMGGCATVPVPRVREIGSTPWGFFVTADRAAGTYLDALSGDEMSSVLPDLLRTLDAVADLAPAGPGYGLWDEHGAAPFDSWRRALAEVAVEHPRTAGWRELLASHPGPARVFERGLRALDDRLDRLEQGWPDPAGPRGIVHSDLLNRNVLVDVARQPGTVTAVLDWGNALYGDPLYDLAWLLFWWPWYPAWSDIDIEAEIDQHLQRVGRRPDDLADRLLAYRWHIGLDSLTYTAFTRRWDTLDRVADQVDALLGR